MSHAHPHTHGAHDAHAITPILNVSNLTETFEWFAKLGWEKLWDWCPPGEAPSFGAVGNGECEIFVCRDGQGGRGEHGAWLSIWVDNVDHVHARCLAEGVEVARPPTDEPWGVREMHVRHPDGHVFRIGQALSTPDTWAIGAAYEPYVGRWSRLVAAEFLPWLRISPGLRWLDVGCGTGELTRAIVAFARPGDVVGIDPSEGFLTYARAHTPEARFEVTDARALPFVTSSFDSVVSGLVLNFVPETAQAVTEMARVLAPGGTVGAYVWDYAAGMQLIRRFWDAAIALDPAALDLDEGRRFPICQPEALRAAFADFDAVEAREIVVATRFADFDDYWSPFLGGQGPAPGYVARLDDDRRSALREHLRSTLAAGADGSISLTARAWAVRGKR